MSLDCNKFNIGEYVVKRFLQEDCGETVIDVSKNKDYWVQDVDFLAVKGERTNKIEVKYDNNIYNYQSFFVELLSNVDNQKPGWIDFTKADYIFYFDTVSYMCYVMKPADLREWLSKNEYQVKYCRKDGYKSSSGAIVPIKSFEEQYTLRKIDLSKYKKQ